MRTILQIISWAAIVATVLLPLLFLVGTMELLPMQWWLLIATIAWFVTAPLWMGRTSEDSANAP